MAISQTLRSSSLYSMKTGKIFCSGWQQEVTTQILADYTATLIIQIRPTAFKKVQHSNRRS